MRIDDILSPTEIQCLDNSALYEADYLKKLRFKIKQYHHTISELKELKEASENKLIESKQQCYDAKLELDQIDNKLHKFIQISTENSSTVKKNKEKKTKR